jgi:hypothetical protein
LESGHSRREREEKVAKFTAYIAVEDAKAGRQKKKQVTKSEARARSKARDEKEMDQNS